MPPIRNGNLPYNPRHIMTGYFIDMDGVLYRGDAPIPSALRFLKRLKQNGTPFLLLTNHSMLTPGQFSKKLRRMGISVPPAQVYSCSDAAAEWLKARQIKRVFAIGEAGLHHALKTRGITRTATRANAVVVGFDRKMRHADLVLACRMVTNGATFVGTNPDTSYPIADGPAPDCGVLLAAIEAFSGKKAVVAGKPSRIIFELASKRLGLPIGKVTMIGDRLDTDVEGAHKAGAKSILVLTGHTTRAMLRRSKIVPHRVVETLDEVRC